MSADRPKAVQKPALVDPLRPTGPRADVWPLEREVAAWTDHYFRRTAAAVRRFGDVTATKTAGSVGWPKLPE